MGIPTGWINHSISKTSPTGFWHKLERGDIPLNDDFYAGFTNDLCDPDRWTTFYKAQAERNKALPKEIPAVPKINGEVLFTEMMAASSSVDPWMFPALERLKSSGRYILAALSNTIIFPPGHALYQDSYYDNPVRRIFDVFISSAHVGVRKPDPRMYALAVQRVDEFAKTHAHEERARGLGWESGADPGDILFLDDIGENLKAAKKSGFGTIKVPLGRAYEAVDELEKVTGMKLAGGHPKVAWRPVQRAKM